MAGNHQCCKTGWRLRVSGVCSFRAPQKVGFPEKVEKSLDVVNRSSIHEESNKNPDSL